MKGLSFLIPWYGSGVAWTVAHRKDGHTLSETIAKLLVNRWTRWPVTAVLVWTFGHIFVLAWKMARDDE